MKMGKLSEYESSLSVELADRLHVDALIVGAGAADEALQENGISVMVLKRERAIELNDLYARGPIVYIKTLEDWRSEGGLRGLELKISERSKAG
jgi:hypothetical protein